MSASERLRELSTTPAGEQIVLNALPLIADVVEAAEAEYENSQLVNDEAIMLGCALTALSSALEEK